MAGRAVVVGFGITGRAVARALVAQGYVVTVVDDRPGPGASGAAAALGVDLVTATPSELPGVVAGAELIVPSPGVPVGHPVFAAAAAAGVAVESEIELAWRVLEEISGPRPLLAAITGTNGKTSVTTLATAMLEASGHTAVAAGNIGVPLVEAVTTGAEVVVAEVSSFQLQFTRSFRPAVSCWLNLAPDHLDWHPSLDHYGSAKARIWANQAGGDLAVVNADDVAVMAASAGLAPGVRRQTFSVTGDADFAVIGRQSGAAQLVGPAGVGLVAVDELPRAMPHDLANGLAAAAVALGAGGNLDGVRCGLRDQRLLPHRVELVAESAGVRYFDDSKATTPASVLAAVAGFSSVVLIAGGRNKGLDLGVLAQAVPPVRAVVAIGDAAGEVAAAFAATDVPVATAADMDDAVEKARAFGRAGDAVLLSPGCASFDWYSSYGAPGDDFARAVRAALQKGESHP